MNYLLHYISNIFSKNYIKYLQEKNSFNFKTCLDIGSGDGSFVRDLINLGMDAEGIEKESDKVKHRVTNKIECGWFNLYYPTNKKYDMITLPQVIYFLENPTLILAKLKTMLNDNGKIFIVTSPVSSQDHLKKYPGHVLFSKDDYIEMCVNLGLKLIDYTEYQSNISTVFNHGKRYLIINFLKLILHLKPFIEKSLNGNHAYILLSNNEQTFEDIKCISCGITTGGWFNMCPACHKQKGGEIIFGNQMSK